MSISEDTDSAENENFATAMVAVIQGCTIETQDKYVAVVNDTLANYPKNWMHFSIRFFVF